ncbi:MAG: alpha/beta fold hydrolase [Candidatus Polarisedimenticolia bacterium]
MSRSFILARRAPLLLRLVLASMGGVAQGESEKELRQLRQRVHPADYEVFAEPGRLEAFGQVMRESLRQGTRGPTWDMRQYVRDFGLGLDEVRMPVTWFHGGRDMNSPMPLVRRVVAGLPGARLVTFEDDAHLSTLCRHFDEVAGALGGRIRS